MNLTMLLDVHLDLFFVLRSREERERERDLEAGRNKVQFTSSSRPSNEVVVDVTETEVKNKLIGLEAETKTKIQEETVCLFCSFPSQFRGREDTEFTYFDNRIERKSHPFYRVMYHAVYTVSTQSNVQSCCVSQSMQLICVKLLFTLYVSST